MASNHGQFGPGLLLTADLWEIPPLPISGIEDLRVSPVSGSRHLATSLDAHGTVGGPFPQFVGNGWFGVFRRYISETIRE